MWDRLWSAPRLLLVTHCIMVTYGRGDRYTDLIHHVQMLAKHTLAAIRDADEDWWEDDWRWRDEVFDVVVPAATGSFRVLLEASGSQGPRFDRRISKALRRVDTLFQHTENLGAALKTAAENRGRVAVAYRKLLHLLAKNRTGLRYAWMGSEIQGIHGGAVSESQAAVLSTRLAKPFKSSSFEQEGSLYRCNSDTGFWGLHTDRGPLRGYVRRDGPDLSGLRQNAWYKFTCDIEYDFAAEDGTVYLTRYELLGEQLPGDEGDRIGMTENDRIVRLIGDGKADLLDGNMKVIRKGLDYNQAREIAIANGPAGGKPYSLSETGDLQPLK